MLISLKQRLTGCYEHEFIYHIFFYIFRVVTVFVDFLNALRMYTRAYAYSLEKKAQSETVIFRSAVQM